MTWHRRNGRDDEGFTLWESVAIVAFIAIVLLGVWVFQRKGNASALLANSSLVAGRLIEQQISLMREGLAGDTTGVWGRLCDGERVDSSSGVVLRWRVGEVAATGNGDSSAVREVTLTARYPTVTPESLVVTTFLARDFQGGIQLVRDTGGVATGAR